MGRCFTASLRDALFLCGLSIPGVETPSYRHVVANATKTDARLVACARQTRDCKTARLSPFQSVLHHLTVIPFKRLCFFEPASVGPSISRLGQSSRLGRTTGSVAKSGGPAVSPAERVLTSLVQLLIKTSRIASRAIWHGLLPIFSASVPPTGFRWSCRLPLERNRTSAARCRAQD